MSTATPIRDRGRATVRGSRRPQHSRSTTVSDTYLLHAIKTAGAANVAPLAAGSAFAGECRVEADRCGVRRDVKAAWEQLSRSSVETVRTLLAGLGVIVVAPRHRQT